MWTRVVELVWFDNRYRTNDIILLYLTRICISVICRPARERGRFWGGREEGVGKGKKKRRKRRRWSCLGRGQWSHLDAGCKTTWGLPIVVVGLVSTVNSGDSTRGWKRRFLHRQRRIVQPLPLPPPHVAEPLPDKVRPNAPRFLSLSLSLSFRAFFNLNLFEQLPPLFEMSPSLSPV